jgi:hypothetical protein
MAYPIRNVAHAADRNEIAAPFPALRLSSKRANTGIAPMPPTLTKILKLPVRPVGTE